VLETRAIVGRLGSKTPITRMMASSLTLNPPWQVPEDIAASQILPKLRQDPNYLASRNMVLVNGPPDDPHGRSINWRQARGVPYYIDQKPGPDNAMGLVMLDSPNDFGVYLHDTPGKSLFASDRRRESNGCIRVEKMLELSALVLGGDSARSAEQLQMAISTGQTQKVRLERPIPVYLLYQTAIPYADGTVGFREDFYGRDRALLARMAA
jgi:murein L,D-transpeptidase YcbB/YkuD